VRAEDLRGMSDFSPFEGKALKGWPVATIKAGQIVAKNGEIIGSPTGRYLPRVAPGAHNELNVAAPR
jgi:dihydropyrimidinase